MDKAFWQKIIDNDFPVPSNHTLEELTDKLLGYLGLIDSELRDDIGFLILANWIDRGLYPPERLRQMISSLKQNLQLGLGAVDADSVFLRSFSILVLSVIVYHDNEKGFLSKQEIHDIVQTSTDYLVAEKDLRGYVIGKGWAHACAHTADIMRFLSRNRHVGEKELKQILRAVATKLTTLTDYVMVHGDEQRLARIVSASLRREVLQRDFWTSWVDNIVHRIQQQEKPHFDPQYNGAYTNAKNFLRALYIKLVLYDEPLPMSDIVQPRLLEALRYFQR